MLIKFYVESSLVMSSHVYLCLTMSNSVQSCAVMCSYAKLYSVLLTVDIDSKVIQKCQCERGATCL